MKYASIVLVSALGAMTGCATATPAPTELVSARAAYDRATRGPASSLALVDLHNARRDLDRAEQSYLSEPESETTRDLSYIALRRAELAEARGNEMQAERERQSAEQRAQQLQAQQLQAAQSALQAQQQQLANTNSQLRNTSAQLAQTNEQLVSEQQARERAEQEAQAAMASLRQMANVREEQRGLVITLSGEVLFPTGQSTLLPIAQQRLDEVAKALKDQGDRRLTVEGHTDSRGSAADNQALSLARAQAVRAFLVSRGIRAEMIEAVGIGPSRPVADNRTAEGRANNRRVEIIAAPVSNNASAQR